MNYLQTRKAQLEKEIAETREYINSLGDTPQDDIRWEREMRHTSRLRTELLELNNKIAKVAKSRKSYYHFEHEITPETTAPESVEEVAPEVETEVESHMNNLQILKAQIEEEVAKAEKFARTLWRSEASDSEVENAMGQLGGLRTTLQLIRNQIAQAELDSYHPTIAATDEPTPEAVTPEVVEEVATKLVVEPISNPAQRAFDGLMNQVKELPQYRKHSLMVISQQPHYVQVEFKGKSNPNWVTLDVMEKADAIHYRLEKRMVNTDTYSDLLDTDEELLAFNYIQKELKRGSLQPIKGKDNYRKLLPELKQVCFSGEADATDLAVYTDRIDKLTQAGELTDAQLTKLNRLMEELTLNWGEQS